MSDTRVARALRTLGSVLALIGGLLLAVSAFLPWLTSTMVFGGVGSGNESVTLAYGMDHGDGIFFLVGGALIAALGLWTALSRLKIAPILLILSGIAFGVLGLFESKSIRDGISNDCCDFPVLSVGEGIVWIYAGAAATFLAGLVLVGQIRGGSESRMLPPRRHAA